MTVYLQCQTRGVVGKRLEREPSTFVPLSAASRKFSARNADSGFTLIELLVVMAIIGILTSLLLTAFNSMSGGFTAAVSDISETMQLARAYAMANNTYVYVGLEEVDANDTSNTPAEGLGLVVLAVAAATDGTEDLSGTTWSGASLLMPISKLKTYRGLHLAQTALSTSGNMARNTPDNTAFYVGSSSCVALTTFTWPLASASPRYTFTKVIRFGPQGDADIILADSSSTQTVDWIEIGLQPMHGNVASTESTTNDAAIQIDGMTGVTRIYRP